MYSNEEIQEKEAIRLERHYQRELDKLRPQERAALADVLELDMEPAALLALLRWQLSKRKPQDTEPVRWERTRSVFDDVLARVRGVFATDRDR